MHYVIFEEPPKLAVTKLPNPIDQILGGDVIKEGPNASISVFEVKAEPSIESSKAKQ